MQSLGSPASVVAAIREDADAEVERLREATAAELAKIRGDAASASVAIADRDLQLARARRECEERVARQEWEGRRAAMEQREEWLQRVLAAAHERWPQGDLDALIAEARSRLPEGECEVIVDPRGGCVVRMGDVSFDNSFEARARRLEPEWRAVLGGMYRV